MFPKALAAAFFATCTICHAGIGVKLVAKGFERPVWVGTVKGIPGKLWVVEQAGQIWIDDETTGEREKEPFLDIRQDVSRKGNEEGLLGLAFAPDFLKSGRFYVNFVDKDNFTFFSFAKFILGIHQNQSATRSNFSSSLK